MTPASPAEPAPVGGGFWPWVGQRLSGLFLAFFLGLHVVLLHFLRDGAIDATAVIARLMASPLMVAFYAAFVVIVVFHGLNGFWGIALDYAPKDGLRRGIKWTLVIVGTLGVLYGLFVLQALVSLR
jgi:succinate dehydrogenase / fumarate reductase membrane anchor subunit